MGVAEVKGQRGEVIELPMPPALETSAASVALEVPSIGALMMMGCCACGNQVVSFLRLFCAMVLGLMSLVSECSRSE